MTAEHMLENREYAYFLSNKINFSEICKHYVNLQEDHSGADVHLPVSALLMIPIRLLAE